VRLTKKQIKELARRDPKFRAALAELDGVTEPKYGNETVVCNGHAFPSIGEMERYKELYLLERAGEISDLKLQPVIPLIVNGIRVGSYRADFRYLVTASDELVYEDFKGLRLPLFRLKKKLVKALYGIEVKETSKPKKGRC